MKRFSVSRAAILVVAVAGLVALGGAGGAVSASLVTSAQIKDQTIQARDIAAGGVSTSETRDRSLRGVDVADGTLGRRQLRDGSIGVDDLSGFVQGELAKQGQDGADGVDGTDGVTELEADGPYPGATQLGDFPGNGRNSTQVWAAGPQHPLQSSWVMCPDGKAAIGGGFSRADEGAAAFRGLQVVTSSPAQIDAEGNVVSVTGGYTAIEGDAVGSFVPNGWLVEGFNNGNADLIVRPWVICAAVND
jgi:hypothetical protein